MKVLAVPSKKLEMPAKTIWKERKCQPREYRTRWEEQPAYQAFETLSANCSHVGVSTAQKQLPSAIPSAANAQTLSRPSHTFARESPAHPENCAISKKDGTGNMHINASRRITRIRDNWYLQLIKQCQNFVPSLSQLKNWKNEKLKIDWSFW